MLLLTNFPVLSLVPFLAAMSAFVADKNEVERRPS